jgi:hypothetical protein
MDPVKHLHLTLVLTIQKKSHTSALMKMKPVSVKVEFIMVFESDQTMVRKLITSKVL